MREILDIQARDLLPDPEDILVQQGVSGPALNESRLCEIAGQARDELAAALVPSGVMAIVATDVFATIFQGHGLNHPDSPLTTIYPRAGSLALFAITCGQAVSDRIAVLFAAHNYALAAAVDAAASLAADRAAECAQARLTDQVEDSPACRGVMRYSPGYCGWHVSGQEALFAHLDPSEVEIKLTRSHLMMPLKSVSGVIIAGPPEIHEFSNDFPFCAECTDHACRDRIEQVRAAAAGGD